MSVNYEGTELRNSSSFMGQIINLFNELPSLISLVRAESRVVGWHANIMGWMLGFCSIVVTHDS